MDVKFILVFVFGIYAFADGHIIIYESEAGHDSQNLDQTPLNIKAEMKDVKAKLDEMKSQIGSLKERFDRLEQAKETTTVSKDTTTKATTTPSTKAPPIMKCPDDWLMFQESCYFFDSNEVHTSAAEKVCKNKHAHLVHLETKEENAFLKSYLSNNSVSVEELYIIGMTDSETEGVWKFTGTNITIPFTDWAGTEPQNLYNKEDCAAFYSRLSYSWADIECSNKLACVVCEKGLAVVGV